MRIGILIPSRGRPEELKRAIESVRATSRHADCLIYIDDDDDSYQQIEQQESQRMDGRAIFHHGSRVGPVGALNHLVSVNPGYGAYGHIADDCEITTKGWDEWLLANLDLVVSPRVSLGPHVDLPFVARAWVDKLGWFAYPGNYHTGWPTVTGCLAAALGRLTYAPGEKFFIQHTMLPSTNQEHLREDAKQLYIFFQQRFETALNVLKR